MGITVTAQEKFRQQIQSEDMQFIADLPTMKGGQGEGPDPQDLFFGAWGACTNMTIQLYCERKGWLLSSVETQFELKEASSLNPQVIKRIRVEGQLTEAQQQQLTRIAEHCPVNRFIVKPLSVEAEWVFLQAL